MAWGNAPAAGAWANAVEEEEQENGRLLMISYDFFPFHAYLHPAGWTKLLLCVHVQEQFKLLLSRKRSFPHWGLIFHHWGLLFRKRRKRRRNKL